MLREMVGAGAGASVCSGRSTGFRGGDGCWAGGGMRKALPGTNSNAPALSLLIVKGDEGEGVGDEEINEIGQEDQACKIRGAVRAARDLSAIRNFS